ncbi:MAG: HDOD domain-containing protein [Myxococcales bacterium]|nr:HDOD domain-containing protein [Myxococcales bacterium]
MTAALARLIEPQIDNDDAFTAGMLHDFGKTAMVNSHSALFAKVLDEVDRRGTSFMEAEQAAFGFDHAALGGRLALRWRLPTALSEAIRFHHGNAETLAMLPELQGRFVAIVALATVCMTSLGIGRDAPIPNIDIASQPAWKSLELDKEDLPSVIETCKKALADAKFFIG